ncbi:hypothetical protein BCV70DRAFT_54862 [Testicularia cyperi]|uniref:Uncharacterized protein n=1 Tax=Testicularia cyperi TaxID=1882483 RepID=A0A317XUN9_9BASI|nr:hypothetical protein BCV70DRAFT_54862 [Testicularia cyperi]
MPPTISHNQARSRLPANWRQSDDKGAPVVAAAAKHRKLAHGCSPVTPIRWSTHTLTPDPVDSGPNDPYDTIRTRSDTSQPYDTFAHRRKSRISDLTCVDLFDEADITSDDTANDLSILTNPTEHSDDSIPLPSSDTETTRIDSIDGRLAPGQSSDSHKDDMEARESEDEEDLEADYAARINRLMASTMHALEASNAIVLDTLTSRAKLAQLYAIEASLDSQLSAREANLRRQIQALDDMSDFVARKSLELQNLVSQQSFGAVSIKSTLSSNMVSADTGATAASGIVEAIDKDATIGKTAAKRLEKMLGSATAAGPSTSSPAASPVGHRRTGGVSAGPRRAFSISAFGFGNHDSIQEEDRSPELATPSDRCSRHQAANFSGPSASASSSATASTATPVTPSKKRSISVDSRASRADGAPKLMSTLAGPSRAVSTGSAASASPLTASPSGAAVPSRVTAQQAGSRAGSAAMRPSLMATLRHGADPAMAAASAIVPLASTSASAIITTGPESGVEPERGLRKATPTMGLPTNIGSSHAESTLAALLGMPASAGSLSSRTDSPSDSSYFGSAMGDGLDDSVTSASPSTPGSIHAIQDMLSKPLADVHIDPDTSAGAMSQPPTTPHISHAPPTNLRRTSAIHPAYASPRASLSLSDRDKVSHLSQLRAEQVTWRSGDAGGPLGGDRFIVGGNGGGAASFASASSQGGGALRALQRLNEMSAAKLAGQSHSSSSSNIADDENSSWYAGTTKRVSLGLGLPTFSALRPSASRSASAAATATHNEEPSLSSAPAGAAADTNAQKDNEAVAQIRLPQMPSAPVTPATHPTAPTQASGVGDTDKDTAPTSGDTSSSLLGGWKSWTSWNSTPTNATRTTATVNTANTVNTATTATAASTSVSASILTSALKP